MVHDVHDDPRWTVVAASAMVTVLESRPMRTMHHDTYARSHWLAPQNRRPGRRFWPIPSNRKEAVARRQPPEKQLTAPADRPVPAAAGTLAGSKGAAAGYDRNGPGSLPPNSPSQNRPPTSPVNHMRCSADHHPRVALCGRCRRPPSGRCLHNGARTRRAQRTPQHGKHPDQAPLCVNCRNLRRMEVQNVTQRTARARGVSR